MSKRDDIDFDDENENDSKSADSTDFLGGLYKSYFRPCQRFVRRLYRKYLGGIFQYIICMVLLMTAIELFFNRRVHKPIVDFFCKRKGQTHSEKRSEGARNLAREERIKHI